MYEASESKANWSDEISREGAQGTWAPRNAFSVEEREVQNQEGQTRQAGGGAQGTWAPRYVKYASPRPRRLDKTSKEGAQGTWAPRNPFS